MTIYTLILKLIFHRPKNRFNSIKYHYEFIPGIYEIKWYRKSLGLPWGQPQITHTCINLGLVSRLVLSGLSVFSRCGWKELSHIWDFINSLINKSVASSNKRMILCVVLFSFSLTSGGCSYLEILRMRSRVFKSQSKKQEFYIEVMTGRR